MHCPPFESLIARLRQGEKITIVTLGDSNTEATFHCHGACTWGELLARGIFMTYGKNRATVINAGQCGDTVAGCFARLERDVYRFRPDLVIVGFGMNDASRGAAGVTDFARDLRRLIGEIRANCSCEILLRTSNPLAPCNEPHYTRPPGRPLETPAWPLHLYVEEVRRAASECGTGLVDHYKLWAEAKSGPWPASTDPNGLWPRMSDVIHPNAFGHRIFYQELAPALGLINRFPWEA